MKNNIKNVNSGIKKFPILALSVMIAFTGCKRGDSLYINPNSPEKVTPALMLTAIEVSIFNSYEGNLVKNASILVQQNAGVDGQAAPINSYNLAENEFDNQWTQIYKTAFSCKDLQAKFGAANPYYSGIADIFSAMNFGLATDLWGDIPFSQALQGEGNYQAKYDAQKDVITGIISMLDKSIVKLQEPAEKILSCRLAMTLFSEEM